MSHKLCTKCKLEKPHDQFQKEPRNKSGLSSWCRQCLKDRLKTPGKDGLTPNQRYHQKNRFARVAHAHNQRALRYGIEGVLTGDDLAAVWEAAGATCSRCPATEDLRFDHRVPLRLGGSNSRENLQLLCFLCHLNKNY